MLKLLIFIILLRFTSQKHAFDDMCLRYIFHPFNLLCNFLLKKEKEKYLRVGREKFLKFFFVFFIKIFIYSIFIPQKLYEFITTYSIISLSGTPDKLVNFSWSSELSFVELTLV